MFKRILFPTKFEEYSFAILKTITCLKNAGLEHVVLLHVIDMANLYTGLDAGTVFDLEAIREAANERLTSYGEYLQSEGIGATTEVAEGRLVSRIIETATGENVSLIVAGRQKRSLLGEVFIGSTTDRIIRQTRVPVLVTKYHTVKEVKGAPSENFCTDMFRKVLYPTDWSSCAERAKAYLPWLREAGASEVVVCHVMKDVFTETDLMHRMAQQLVRAHSEKLEALQQELQSDGFQVKACVLQGDKPYQAINRLATDEDVSMIVMGSHGKGFIEETLWGSVSQRVVEYSEKPVLVVK